MTSITSRFLRVVTLVAAVVSFAIASGCSETETTQLVANVVSPPALTGAATVGGGGGVGGVGGSIYVADLAQNAILRFGARDNGDVPPRAIISGAATLLNGPTDVTFDQGRDTLYVLNFFSGTVTVYANVSQANGNIAPTRVIAFTDITSALVISLDTARDTLYVGALAPLSISAYANAATVNTTVTSVRQITGPTTQINGVSALRIDSQSDRLTLVSGGPNRVIHFDVASTKTGDVAPDRTLSGASTGLATPVTISFDSAQNMFIANIANSTINVYTQGASASGNTPPAISASSAMTFLGRPVFSTIADGNTYYISDSNNVAVLVYSASAFVAGNQAPIQAIIGPTTQLRAPNGIAHDPFR